MCQQELGGSAPGVSGSDASTTPPYAAGQQAQQQQQDREEKEKLRKMKEKKKNDSEKKKKKYSAEEIIEYIDVLYRVNASGGLNGQLGIIDEDPEVLEAWQKTLKQAGYTGAQGGSSEEWLGNECYRALERNINGNLSYIYRQPEIADSSTSSTDSIDGLITDSDNFINKGSNDKINDKSIQDFSKTLYNILITIATVVSVIIGGILGIKIMLASAEEKAQVKELLVPYVIGCVVVFGAFGIWKLVVNILQNI